MRNKLSGKFWCDYRAGEKPKAVKEPKSQLKKTENQKTEKSCTETG